MDRLDTSVRRVLLLICLFCIGLLGFSQYLQQVGGVDPCPMCIVQRYVFVLLGLVAGVTTASHRRGAHIAGALVLVPLAGFGAYVAARQSWLQWYPPEVVSCGRDFYGMIENFPLQRAIPMIFKGSGDCSKVDWTLLGGSIANWTFLAFSALCLLCLFLLWRLLRGRRS